MIKSELMAALAANLTHLPEHHIASSVNHMLELMSNALIEGNRIEIRGFGSFSVHERPPRHAHNPKTGEKITTTAKKTAHFKPGKALRERVNNSRKKYSISD